MLTYQWADGSPFTGPVEPVVKALRKLESRDARAVVQAARVASSPLHPYVFYVGERVAAQKHYEDRARLLVRSVVWVKREGDRPHRAWQFIAPDVEEGEERGPRIIVSDADMQKRPEWKQQVIARLEREVDRALADLEGLGVPYIVRPLKQLSKALHQVA